MATIMITGGTGMIGTALSNALVERGHEVIILTRDKSRHAHRPGFSYAAWDVSRKEIEKDALAAADVIVHLAGANIAGGRWTRRRKEEIRDSRIKSSELLVEALSNTPNKVKAVISASAIGYYGPDPSIPNPKPFVEDDKPFHDFLATVVQEWEQAIGKVAAMGKRHVAVRTGIVLSKEGGAYEEFRKTLRFGLATILGSGRQIISWIALEDLIRIYIEAIENQEWKGSFNAVAPRPVSNKELVMAIAGRQKLRLPVKVPAFALRLVLGELSTEVLISTTVSADKLLQHHFQFLYPTLEQAIQKLEAS